MMPDPNLNKKWIKSYSLVLILNVIYIVVFYLIMHVWS